MTAVADILSSLYCWETWPLAAWEQLFYLWPCSFKYNETWSTFMPPKQQFPELRAPPCSRPAGSLPPVYTCCWYSRQFAFLQEVLYSLLINHTFSIVTHTSSPFYLKLQCRLSSLWSRYWGSSFLSNDSFLAQKPKELLRWSLDWNLGNLLMFPSAC